MYQKGIISVTHPQQALTLVGDALSNITHFGEETFTTFALTSPDRAFKSLIAWIGSNDLKFPTKPSVMLLSFTLGLVGRTLYRDINVKMYRTLTASFEAIRSLQEAGKIFGIPRLSRLTLTPFRNQRSGDPARALITSLLASLR